MFKIFEKIEEKRELKKQIEYNNLDYNIKYKPYYKHMLEKSEKRFRPTDVDIACAKNIIREQNVRKLLDVVCNKYKNFASDKLYCKFDYDVLGKYMNLSNYEDDNVYTIMKEGEVIFNKGLGECYNITISNMVIRLEDNTFYFNNYNKTPTESTLTGIFLFLIEEESFIKKELNIIKEKIKTEDDKYKAQRKAKEDRIAKALA